MAISGRHSSYPATPALTPQSFTVKGSLEPSLISRTYSMFDILKGRGISFGSIRALLLQFLAA